MRYITYSSRETVAVVASKADSKLQYHRLRHMSGKRVKLLASKGKLPDLKSIVLVHVKIVFCTSKNASVFLRLGENQKREN